MKPTPPVYTGYPLIGNMIDFQKNRVDLIRRGYEALGPVFTLRLGRQNAAILIGPEPQQVFFQETDKKLSMHKTYRFLTAMFGEIAFAAPKETYYEQRPILHSPFKREKMPHYIGVMQEEIQDWLDGLGVEGELELISDLTQLIQHVAAHALLGEEFRRSFDQEFWDLYGDLSRGLDPVLPPNLPLPRFRRRERAKIKIRAMLMPLIDERRKNPDSYQDFLQDLVTQRYKDGRMVENEVILGLIMGLLFAGHETTVGQASWSVIQLVQNPHYLRAVQEEIAQRVPPGTQFSLELLKDLRHIEGAVRETERMHPSTDILLRYVEEEIEVADYRVPAGWIVMVSPAVSQRTSELFSDPDCYDPLRFAPGREEHRQHQFSLITFGGGVHKCTGMNFAYHEMMMIVSLLFQQFDLELVTKDPQTEYGLGASRPAPTQIRYRRKV